jgi:hypothetical protein
MSSKLMSGRFARARCSVTFMKPAMILKRLERLAAEHRAQT